jgi:putative transposon-encoded protein
MPRKLILSREQLVLSEDIEGFIRKKVTPFGTGAKVDCPKEFIGKTAYLVIVKEPRTKTWFNR